MSKPWITKGILTSVKIKNKLHDKAKRKNDTKNNYNFRIPDFGISTAILELCAQGCRLDLDPLLQAMKWPICSNFDMAENKFFGKKFIYR